MGCSFDYGTAIRSARNFWDCFPGLMGIVKSVLVGLGGLICSAVSAQLVSPAQSYLQAATAPLTMAPALRADLQGTDQDPRGTRQIGIASAYQQGRFAANEYVGKSLSRRFCADGSRFWVGDFAAQTYSVVGYGPGSNDGTGAFVKSPTLAFVGAARGPAGFIARLFEDLYGGANPRLPKWLTNTTPTYVGLENEADFRGWLTDPILPGRSYLPTESRFFVFEYQGRPVHRALVWQFQGDWNEEAQAYLNPQLIGVSFSERIGSSSTGVIRQWTLTLKVESSLFNDATFQFSPPPSWQPIALPTRGDGG